MQLATLQASDARALGLTCSLMQGWCIANAGECLAVQLPGRNLRRNEPFLGSPQEVAQALLPVVASSIASVPYVVGHCAASRTQREYAKPA